MLWAALVLQAPVAANASKILNPKVARVTLAIALLLLAYGSLVLGIKAATSTSRGC